MTKMTQAKLLEKMVNKSRKLFNLLDKEKNLTTYSATIVWNLSCELRDFYIDFLKNLKNEE